MINKRTRRKVSHFIVGEEGRVGSKSAFVGAAVVGAASFTAMLLGAPQKALAEVNCGPALQCGAYCCWLNGSVGSGLLVGRSVG